MHKTLTNINTQLTSSLLKSPHFNSKSNALSISKDRENPQMMELIITSSDHHHFKALGRDLVIDIMSRLDALSLIAASATCIDLRDAAEDEILWKSSCHKTWPSTSKLRLSHDEASFRRFFSDAFPLVSYDLQRPSPERVSTRLEGKPLIPRGFASFVDIYYKGRCIFSKALDTLLTDNDVCGDDSVYAFRYHPFRLDLVGLEKESRDVLGIIAEANVVPSGTCSGIDEEMRLSWIIYDETKGRAFNISSWKPRWASARNRDYTICFGCVVPVEEDVSTAIDRTLAEFVITVRLKLVVEEEEIVVRWKQIELVVMDIDGTHFTVDRSMRVIDRAFGTVSRSVSRRRVEAGYTTFVSKKMQLKTRVEREEALANFVSATIAIATLVGICYACATLL